MWLKLIVNVGDSKIDVATSLDTFPTPSGVGQNRDRFIYRMESIYREYIESHPTDAKLVLEENAIENYCDKIIDVLRTDYARQYEIYFSEPTQPDSNPEDEVPGVVEHPEGFSSWADCDEVPF